MFAHGPQALPSNMSGGKITLRIDGQPVEKVLPTAGTIFRVPELGAKVFTQLRDESTDTVRERIQEYADTQAVAAVRAALHLLSDRPIMPSCLIEAGLLLPRSRFRLRPRGVQREQEARHARRPRRSCLSSSTRARRAS